MFRVSRDTPAYYLTSVAHNRIPIFRTDTIKQIVCEALDETRRNHDIKLFAYVIMPDHSHLVTDDSREIKDVLRLLNGISAKRIIDHLKANNYESSLAKLRIQDRGNNHKHSVYEHHPNALRLTGEDSLMRRVNYIHFNPVKAGLCEHPNDYRFSSARQWNRKPFDDEPLLVDLDQLHWR